ncbi:MAG: hypothetical protein WDN30_03450 [Pararobbsia sp.]
MPFHRFWKASRTFVTVCMTAQLLAGCVTVGGTDVSDRVAIDALANGIALRPADGSLFVTDDKTHSVLVSHDRQVFTSYAALPAGDGPSEALSQVTVMRDTGTPVVARFGFGTSGAVFGMPRAGTVVPWSGLAPDRRRLGLVDIGAQRVLSTWFVKHAGEPATGGLSMLTYDESLGAAVERDLVTGFDKPVGVRGIGRSGRGFRPVREPAGQHEPASPACRAAAGRRGDADRAGAGERAGLDRHRRSRDRLYEVQRTRCLRDRGKRLERSARP